MDWINLSQDRKQWRALVDTAMKLRAPYDDGDLSTEALFGSQDELSYTEWVSYL